MTSGLFFTNKKLFIISPLLKSQVCASLATKKRDISANRLLHMCSTFSKFVMVSVVVSKLRYTNLILLNLEQKSMGNTPKMCCCRIRYASDQHYCWRRVCLPARLHQHIMLATLLSFCAMRHPIHQS